MFTERAFPTGQVSLNVMAGPPAGSPLVLLHGVTRRWSDFSMLLPILASFWQVHGLDFRGHGRSGRSPGQYHVADYVRDTVAFVQSLDAPAVILGHSLGALVALAVAAELPDKVRAVVLEDPPAVTLIKQLGMTSYHALFAGLRSLAGRSWSVSEVARELAELRLPGTNGDVRLGDLRDATSLRFSARCLQDLDPEVLTPLLEGRWLDGYEPEAIWRGTRCPVLLLRADDSCGGMLSRADARQMAGQLADCTLLELPGVGHLLHWLAPEATLRFVAGFLHSL